jgi:ubiquinone/menaquinone biosynthesis C-methylase UbiE
VIWVWLALGLVLLALGLFLYWAFIITEGAYLGSRTVALTYDLTARRYDGIKQFNPFDDARFLAMPMIDALHDVECPLVLDVATGTGRMVHALLDRPSFDGTVIGLDLSYRMLQQAEAKLHDYAGRHTLIWYDAQHLPFPDDTFDAVSCLEALEFMPSSRRVLVEIARVLRPGGALLVTNRINWERHVMPGKAFTDPQLRALFLQAHLVNAKIRPWQVYYDLIWAHKTGSQSRLGRGMHELPQILRCPRCMHSPLRGYPGHVLCPSCGLQCPIHDHICSIPS